MNPRMDETRHLWPHPPARSPGQQPRRSLTVPFPAEARRSNYHRACRGSSVPMVSELPSVGTRLSLGRSARRWSENVSSTRILVAVLKPLVVSGGALRTSRQSVRGSDHAAGCKHDDGGVVMELVSVYRSQLVFDGAKRGRCCVAVGLCDCTCYRGESEAVGRVGEAVGEEKHSFGLIQAGLVCLQLVCGLAI